jgi:hypothetical protein
MALSDWPLVLDISRLVRHSWKVLKAMLDAAAHWQRFPTLYDRTLIREREWPDNQSIAAY